MAHFAKLDENNVVLSVHVVNNDVITDENGDDILERRPTTYCNVDGSASSQGAGYAIPCSAIAQVQQGGASGDTNSFDPDLEMPTHKKLSIGMKRQIGEYDVQLDYMWSRNKSPFYVYNLQNNNYLSIFIFNFFFINWIWLFFQKTCI